MSQPLLIFLHVPKTAGSTFSTVLRALYPSRSCAAYSVEAVETLKQKLHDQGDSLDMIEGHFPYGIHANVSRPVRYITFLRDPVDRVISLYRYICWNPENYLHETVTSNNLSLEDFLHASLTPETENFQVHFISGGDGTGRVDPSCVMLQHLDLAKERLERDYFAFGLTDRFDESLVRIATAMNWPLNSHALYYQNQNVVPRSSADSRVTSRTIAEIRRRNRLDIELYEHARRLYARTVRWHWITKRRTAAFARRRLRWLVENGM